MRARALSAKDFVLRGETLVPFIRSQNRNLTEKVERQETQIAGLMRTVTEQKEALGAAMNLARHASEQGYKRAVAEAEARRDAAAEVGDVQAVRQVQQEIDTLRDERPAAPEPAREPDPAPAPPAAAAPDPDIAAFIEANGWFKTNGTMRSAMMANHQIVMDRTPGLPMTEQLKRAKARLVADFPEYFPNERAPAPALEDDMPNAEAPPARRRAEVRAVEMPGDRPRPQRTNSPFDRIEDAGERAEQRAAFTKYQKSDPKADPAEWVALYLDPHMDLLAYRERTAK
jgi:hypothetical protein